MPLKDTMTLVKEPQPQPVVPLSWFLPSLFAAFNVMLLVFVSGLFFGFPWLAQNGEWVFPVVTGPLFVLTFYSLVSLNFSDPGILHRGSAAEDPMTVHVVSVNQRAFRLQWCPKCCFHRPPRTCHCPWCNICVEDFDHHCKWVNNCIGHRNFRLFMLLILSLCLYSGALLVTCLMFLVRTRHLPFSVDKVMAYLHSILVALPAAGFLIPLVLLLLIHAVSVSAAERSCESKCRYHPEHNPFDQGFVRNWYLTMCAPLGPKYMSEVVCLQRPVGTEWIYEKMPPSPPACPPEHCSPGSPVLQHQPQAQPQLQPQPPLTARKGPSGSGEAVIVLQEIDASPRLSLLSETPRRGAPRRSQSLDPLNLRLPV